MSAVFCVIRDSTRHGERKLELTLRANFILVSDQRGLLRIVVDIGLQQVDNLLVTSCGLLDRIFAAQGKHDAHINAAMFLLEPVDKLQNRLHLLKHRSITRLGPLGADCRDGVFRANGAAGGARRAQHGHVVGSVRVPYVAATVHVRTIAAEVSFHSCSGAMILDALHCRFVDAVVDPVIVGLDVERGRYTADRAHGHPHFMACGELMGGCRWQREVGLAPGQTHVKLVTGVLQGRPTSLVGRLIGRYRLTTSGQPVQVVLYLRREVAPGMGY